MLHDGEGEADEALGHQLLLGRPQHQQQLHPVPQLLEADQHQRRVRVAGDAVLELEQRPVLGEEALLPVLAARLVHGLDGVVLPVGLVNIHTPHQDRDVAADNLKHALLQLHFGTVGFLDATASLHFSMSRSVSGF